MEISLPIVLAASPPHRETLPTTPLDKPLLGSLLSGRNPPRTRTSRDRGALVSKRNEAEARLRSRFLRFGSAVRKLVGDRGGGVGDDGGRFREHRANKGSREDGGDGGGDGAPASCERNAKSPPVTDSRLDDLRKRQSHLESPAFTPKPATTRPPSDVASGSAPSTEASAGDRTLIAPPSGPPPVALVATIVGDSSAAADEDRTKRIEALKSRRRHLEARTNQLLRGEGSAAGREEQPFHGSFSDPSARTPRASSSSSVMLDDPESGHPKRPRRELSDVALGPAGRAGPPSPDSAALVVAASATVS